MAMYPTPAKYEDRTPPQTTREMDQKNFQKKMSNLASRVRYETMYPTPTVGCEVGGEQSKRVERTKSGGFILRKKNRSSIVGNLMQEKNPPQPGGKLNPNFVEFLMGYPMNYTQIEPTELKHSETQSCHKSQNKSSGVS
jgi:hypothetical protein